VRKRLVEAPVEQEASRLNPAEPGRERPDRSKIGGLRRPLQQLLAALWFRRVVRNHSMFPRGRLGVRDGAAQERNTRSR